MILHEVRERIDRIDSEIIKLLSQRSELVAEAGKLKKDEAAVRDRGRAEKVIGDIRRKALDSGLDPEIAEEIYRTAIQCFIQKELMESGYYAVCDGIRVYRNDTLRVKPGIQGTAMWAVALENTMLTYFEMKPDTVFPEHSHEAEQITMILEGTLTFVYDGKEIDINEGEVIAIPSNAAHAAYTKNRSCRAVDAWSPVRKEFL